MIFFHYNNSRVLFGLESRINKIKSLHIFLEKLIKIEQELLFLVTHADKTWWST